MVEQILEIDSKFLYLVLVSMFFVAISMVTYFIAKKHSYTKVFWLEISNLCLLIAVFALIILILNEISNIKTLVPVLGVGAIVGYLFIWYGFKKTPISNHGSHDNHG